MAYLSSTAIEDCLQWLAATYPALTNLIVMPEQSVEGRTIRAIKIASGEGCNRRGVLFIGGTHARELINPDLLVTLALKLCQAYTNNTGLTFGGKSYTSASIKLIIQSLDIFILPLLNPDGRVYVQTTDAWWRKNRRINAGSTCKGVDLNRNYDFLSNYAIGSTSTSPCSDTFKGPSAFSEPETRNVRHMLNTYPNIIAMQDVHSYSQLILYPWGDDDNQTTDPAMNFMNPAFDGMRGTLGDMVYKEYIPASDLDWFVSTGNRMRDAIAAVRGRVYTVEPASQLYPTSGTSKDYGYSRHFVNAAKRRVYAYTLETGLEFQPAYAEALNIMSEASAGLIEFCLASLCIVEDLSCEADIVDQLDDIRLFRDKELWASERGRAWTKLFRKHNWEISALVLTNPNLRKQAVVLLKHTNEIVASRKRKPKIIDTETLKMVDNLANQFLKKASPRLKKAITEVQDDLKHFKGKSISEIFNQKNNPPDKQA
jgi:carboxypeptidase T